MELVLGDDNPMPQRHQLLQLVVAAVAGFLADRTVRKVYLSAWKFFSKRKRG